MSAALWFLWASLLAVCVQGFFSLFEMAAVSFNKVRLQYFIGQGKKRAIWLNDLLSRPSRLFGSSLIGVNVALQMGSECARRFYEALSLNPDWAPLSQTLLVIVFAELSPMFAARRHPSQVAMALVPIAMFFSRLFSPIIWAFDALSRAIHAALHKSSHTPLFLSREEVRMAFEETEGESEGDLSATAGTIFDLKHLTAGECMLPLSSAFLVSSTTTINEVRHLLSGYFEPQFAIYHRSFHNVVGTCHLRSLIGLPLEQKVLDHAKSPWFVPAETSILQIIEQFRRNGQSLAVVLDSTGQSAGLLSLDQVLTLIFGEEAKRVPVETEEPALYLERTLSGEMTIVEFNRQFLAHLPLDQGETLSELICARLGHAPAKEESLKIEPFLFTVVEPTLSGVKTLIVQTSSE